MIYFDTDYMEGAHPLVLRRLVETNSLHTVGYGRDAFTARAKKLILDRCGIENGEVYFLVGGTQTNAVVLDRLLDHNDGVLATDTAHINVHEAGAIESNGNKILTLPGHDGKLAAKDIREYVETFYSDATNEFMVRPGAVYISFPTELGTLYSLDELRELRAVCDEFRLPLYIDGARLAYGLKGEGNDVTLRDIAALSDAFYIGGTKCGTLFGEAIVTRRPDLFPRFASLIKLHGATLAKGRLLGVQFEALFDEALLAETTIDNDYASDTSASDENVSKSEKCCEVLYDRIGEHAICLAMKLREAFHVRGYKMLIESPTNQQFVILPNDKLDSLHKVASFELWGPRGATETAVRFVTDWSTTEEDVDLLIANL